MPESNVVTADIVVERMKGNRDIADSILERIKQMMRRRRIPATELPDMKLELGNSDGE